MLRKKYGREWKFGAATLLIVHDYPPLCPLRWRGIPCGGTMPPPVEGNRLRRHNVPSGEGITGVCQKEQRYTMRKNNAEMLPEYDFSKGVRGKYATRYAKGIPTCFGIVLEPDVAKVFSNSAIVNETLRAVVNVARRTQKRSTVLT